MFLIIVPFCEGDDKGADDGESGTNMLLGFDGEPLGEKLPLSEAPLEGNL